MQDSTDGRSSPPASPRTGLLRIARVPRRADETEAALRGTHRDLEQAQRHMADLMRGIARTTPSADIASPRIPHLGNKLPTQ